MSGIGLAIAQWLLSQPASHKLVVLSRTQSALDQIKQQYPEQVETLAGDLADFSFGAKAVELAVSKWGRVDSIIVNHGALDPVKRVQYLSSTSIDLYMPSRKSSFLQLANQLFLGR
jgi:NADP-dependent 3-hydroxy acid dehydrogenase YdfG